MKKTLIAVIGLVMAHSLSINGQSLELNVKGTGNTTWLFNPNISNDGDEQDLDIGWGFNYGGGITFYINKHIGVGADLLLNQHACRFTGKFPAPLSSNFSSSSVLKSTNIPLMIKLRSNTGGFFELGVQFSSLKSANYTIKWDGNSRSSDVKITYPSSWLSAVLGMGANIKMSDRASVLAGIRFIYSIDDVEGVDAYGRDLGNALYYPLIYDKYKPSHLFSGGLFLGFAFTIGKVDD